MPVSSRQTVPGGLHRVFCSVLLAASLAAASIAGLAADDAQPPLESLTVGGVERQWQLRVPSGYRDSLPLPLVLELHGTGGTPERQMRLSGLSVLAEEEGFLLAAPVAMYPRAKDGMLTWNVDLHPDAVDDVAFIAALIDHISDHYAVDPTRIYATGFSGGARMSSRLACDLADRVAAIGAVGGLRYPEDCQPARPVPVIAFHGRQDRVNHYVYQPDSPDYWRMGVEDALSGWVRHNGCAPRPQLAILSISDVRLAYPDCQDNAEVIFYRSEVADHTWPGSPLAGRMREYLGEDSVSDVPATTLIWNFFRAHSLPVNRLNRRP